MIWVRLSKGGRAAVMCALVGVILFSSGWTHQAVATDPAAWQALTGTKFVSTTGDDANLGTEDKPWGTIQWGVDHLVSGDVLIIEDGIYAECTTVRNMKQLPPAGETPTVIRARTKHGAILRGAGLRCYWNGNQRFDEAHNIVIGGLRIEDAECVISFQGNMTGTQDDPCIYTDITIIDCCAENCGWRPEIGWSVVDIRKGENITVENVHLNEVTNGFGFGMHGHSGVLGLTVKNCSAIRTSEVEEAPNRDGFRTEELCEDIVISGCVASGFDDSGFDIKGDGAIVEQCVAYKNWDNGFKLWGDGAKLINSIAYDNDDTGVTAGGNIGIHNCTLAYNRRVAMRPQPHDISQLVVRNTVFAHSEYLIKQYSDDHGGPGVYDDDHNLYYKSNDSWYAWKDYGLGQVWTLADMKDGTLQMGEHSIFVDPLFVDEANRDLRLQSDSPCIGAGVNIPFISDDFHGYLRVGPFDIGAHQYNGVSPTGHEVSITELPAGDPNPVASGGEAQCRVTAEDNRGIDLRYEWTAEDEQGNAAGSFDDATVQNPTWTAPENDSDEVAEYTITITATCSVDPSVSDTAWYKQQVVPVAHEVRITEHPAGDPSPVPSGGEVQCTVAAEDSRAGHALSYHWTAKNVEGNAVGSFDDTSAQNPIWTAPENRSDQVAECIISVTVTCNEDENVSASASYTQQVNPVAHQVRVTEPPAGDPNPVASGGAVQCNVAAEDSRVGHTLTYQWSAVDAQGNPAGSFNDASAQHSTWTAPENRSDEVAECTITVTVTCCEDEGVSTSASYTQRVNPVAHEVAIVQAPVGNPNPVVSGGQVACSVVAQNSREGYSLTYHWTSEDAEGRAVGSFDDPNGQNPSWTAPENASDVSCECIITVTATCSEDENVKASASYTQRVAVAPVLCWLNATGFESDCVDPDRGEHLDWYTFKVRYYGVRPEYVRLHLFRYGVEVEGSPYDINPGSGEPETGQTFWFKRRLCKGTYTYYFSASDGKDQACGEPTQEQVGPVSHNRPPRMEWAGEGEWEWRPVYPQGRNLPGTEFQWKVKYIDREGDPPEYVHLHLARRVAVGEGFEDRELDFSPVEMTAESKDYMNGAVFTHTRALYGEGRYVCWFSAKEQAADGFEAQDAYGVPTWWRRNMLWVFNAPPRLTWVPGADFAGDNPQDGLHPNSVQVAQPFTFKVQYRDQEGTQPDYVRVHLLKWNGKTSDDASYSEVPMSPYSMSTEATEFEIADYSAVVQINEMGRYRYYFTASDGDKKAIGEPSWRRMPGPTVDGAQLDAVHIGSLSCCATSEGAQMTFVLSKQAAVTAEVLNIAGRLVKVLVADRPMPAETNILTWDGRSANGLAVPSGLYLARVRACTDDGSKCQVIGAVKIMR